MKKSSQTSRLLEPISALQKLTKITKVKWMVIGGVAASLLAKPRFTADVDAVVLADLEKIPEILKSAKRIGLKPRIKDAEGFARKNKVFLLRHEKSSVNIDLSIGLLPFEKEAVRRSRRYKVGDVTINLPTVEDLIIFKAVAHRPQDILDIQEIIKLHPRVNKVYIKRHLTEFARILEIPEIWTDVQSLLRASS